MSAPRTARDRVREEITHEILRAARSRLAHDGAAALSLRSIARDLEMAPSALYRYFDGRDALLSALILTAYESLAEAVERAEAVEGAGGDPRARWPAVPRAMRVWALAHPHEWALIFGSPVPGYAAPEATVAPYVRVAAALVRPLVDAHAGGEGRRGARGARVPRADRPLAEALRPVIEELLPGLPTGTVAAAVRVWATLIGLISLEVFGHWRNTVLDPDLFFEDAVAEAGAYLGLRYRRIPPGR